MNENRKFIVLVALQQALLGEVSASLRAVTVAYTEHSIHFDCYYDGEIREDHYDAMSCVETELIAAFPEDHTITHNLHREDVPNSIPKNIDWVFYRKESC